MILTMSRPPSSNSAPWNSRVARFWTKVNRGGADECWEWIGSRNKDGYGHVSFRGKVTNAHRIALSLTDGLWDSPLATCHSCDNRACCNPAHLWRGTQLDNMRDCKRKNRLNKIWRGRKALPSEIARGENSGNSKLTEAKVKYLRTSQKTLTELAEELGVHRQTVFKIKHHVLWKHVND